MANDIAPGFVKIFYTSNSNPHVQTLPVDYDASTPTPGNDPILVQADGGTMTGSAAVAAWVAVFKTLFAATATFTGFEFYEKTPGNDPTFVFGDDLNIVGTNGGAVVPMEQVVYSFRTGAGGVLKIYGMEASVAVNVRLPLRVSSAAPHGAIATYLLSGDNFIVGRDNAFPISGIYVTSKLNDALRKRQLLDN